ncbi:MAG TPA: WecB/TagA/CpsF family glycosyltransferase [Gaiellaceae bacterium]|jgi:N-acetylglucosaminyldiphosphoundecaprenol N-acetyl-beta-D-mannosaminyltransferase
MAVATRDRARVLGCEIDRLTMAQTVERCLQIVESGRIGQHVAVNVAKLVALQDDPRLREIVAGCDVISADGQPIVWASRLLRDPLPERVAGIDLMHELLRVAEATGYRVYFLGARPDVLERAVARIRVDHPLLEIAGYRDGYFSDAENAAVAAAIREARAHMLFVAISSPRKEYWLAQYGQTLGVRFLMGVGGTLDVVAGVRRRAPSWVQRAGLEWLFRVAQEPRRLGFRYLTTNWAFLAILVAALKRRVQRQIRSGTNGGAAR